MTAAELKNQGAIYFENVVDGMKGYENHILQMDMGQACAKFTDLWEQNSHDHVYVDFYYHTLPEEARTRIDRILTAQERAYVQQMNPVEGEVIFPVDEELISICTKLNHLEILFSTFYVTGEQKSTWWGNYDQEYMVFTEKETEDGRSAEE